MSQVAKLKLESEPDPEVTAVTGMRTRLLALAAACVLGGLALAAGLALH